MLMLGLADEPGSLWQDSQASSQLLTRSVGVRLTTTPQKLTPEMVEQCLGVAQDIDAGMANKLKSLRRQNPEQFDERLRHSAKLVALAALKQRDPNLYQLTLTELRVDQQVAALAEELRNALASGGAEKSVSLRQQLLNLVRLQTAFAFRAKQEYVCRLEEFVDRLEKDLDREARSLDAAVEKRMAALEAPRPPELRPQP